MYSIGIKNEEWYADLKNSTYHGGRKQPKNLLPMVF
jgi:hypothetical protein